MAGGSRAERVVVQRDVIPAYTASPILVPDCEERWTATLLKCAPRAYVVPQDTNSLNQLNAVPARVVRPYPYLFSW
jgi:hypothetical protein